MKWFRRLFNMHIWKYHNPYNRTCTVCNKHQVEYCNDYSEVNNPTKGWWETYDEGDLSKHE